MKKNLLILLIGIIIGTTITATAAYVYTARDIGYSPSDENWNVSNVQDAINEIKTDVNNINDLVDQGDMLYPVGTNIVGLVSDDTPYKDSNDKYILADSTTGKNMMDNVTYKSISSTETLKGKVGSDSVSEYNTVKPVNPNKYTNNAYYLNVTTDGSSIQCSNYTTLYIFRKTGTYSDYIVKFLDSDGVVISNNSYTVSPSITTINIPSNAIAVNLSRSGNGADMYYAFE